MNVLKKFMNNCNLAQFSYPATKDAVIAAWRKQLLSVSKKLAL